MTPNDHPLIKEEAEIVQKKLKYETHGFDPITILMIISCIISLLRLIQGCRKHDITSADVTKMAKLRIGRLKVANVIYAVIGPVEYDTHGRVLTNAIMERGREIQEENLTSLVGCLDD
jgi:hypothetical protein